MAAPNLTPTDRLFNPLWYRVRGSPAVAAAALTQRAVEAGLHGVEVVEAQAGTFFKFPALHLDCEEGRACFPRHLPDDLPGIENRKKGTATRWNAWKAADWFDAPFVTNGVIDPVLRDLIPLAKDGKVFEGRAEETLEHHLPTMYAVARMAWAIEVLFPVSRSGHLDRGQFGQADRVS